MGRIESNGNLYDSSGKLRAKLERNGIFYDSLEDIWVE